MRQKLFGMACALLAICSLPAEDLVYGVPVTPFPSAAKLENPYGICAHLSRGPKPGTPATRKSDWELRELEMRRMNDAGIGYFRTDFDWDHIQQTKDAPLRMEHLDAMMKSAASHKLEVLPILGGHLPDARPGWKHADLWKKYVTALVERYRKQISFWEVWNEMNYSGFWGDKVSPQEYTKLLKATSETIKAADPEAKVIFGGLAGLDLKFLEQVCREKGYEYFDVMNYHSYNSDGLPEEKISEFRRLQRLMDKYNWKKPVWITEVGASTSSNDPDNGLGFWREVLPQALKKINIDPAQVTIGLIADFSRGFIGAGMLDANTCFGYFKDYRHLTLDELNTLDPKKVPVLVPMVGEAFPATYLDALKDYVRKGGTVIFSSGVPLYMNISVTGETIGDKHEFGNKKHFQELHINNVFWWSEDAKAAKVPEKPAWQRPAAGFDFQYRWNFRSWQGARYLDGKNLKPGDEFIPVLQSGNDDYTGAVIGIYKLNSDLRGNLIIQTRNVWEHVSSIEDQAKRVPRTYLISMAFGVEKIFWYNLRAFERTLENREDHFGIVHNDPVMSAKPAFTAYQVLTSMCPDGSTRPTLTEQNGVFLSTWTTPDNTRVAAVWTPALSAKIRLNVQGNAKYFDYMGGKVSPDAGEFIATDGVTYIVGADSVSF